MTRSRTGHVSDGDCAFRLAGETTRARLFPSQNARSNARLRGTAATLGDKTARVWRLVDCAHARSLGEGTEASVYTCLYAHAA
eukprot:3260939-Pleurochrysis_carterae.AAC.1